MDRFHEVAKVLEDHGIVVRPEDVVMTQRLRGGVTMVYVARGGAVVRFYIVEEEGGVRVLGPEILVPRPKGVLG